MAKHTGFWAGLTLAVAAALPLAAQLALAGAATWALWRHRPEGFAGAWFFLILAPTSSVVPVIQQPVAENRPYLPLAALVSLGVLALHARTGRRATLAGSEQTWSNGLLDAYQLLHAGEKNRRTLHLWRDSREGSLKVDHILVSRGAQVMSLMTSGVDDKPVALNCFRFCSKSCHSLIASGAAL